MLPSNLFILLSAATTFTVSNALPAPQSLPEPHYAQIGERRLNSESLGTRATKTEYVAYAVAGINQMMTWYNAATGLWQEAWWPSANVVTMLANFHEYFPDMAKGITDQVFTTTFAVAERTFPGFINGFYDDELWWVLAWIQVYDVTNDQKYLDKAAAIFEDSKNAWGQSPCGGLWWDKAHTAVGAVENELYLSAAAKLANRRPNNPSGGYYFNEAIKAYEWFVNSGLINSDNVINNGLVLSTCKNDGNLVFSYNQGILLSGLAELTWSTGDAKYNELANTIALAAMKNLTNSDGILTDPCDRGCNSDTEQFKGVFGRGIQFLVNRAVVLPDATRVIYVDFLTKNADSIWAYDQVDNQLGLVWSGPKGTASIQTQSSALDAIVGAACVS
ncbi:glycoside hydrolase [Rhexocercosporidium sp. MPI-PUGE-AT-0058]|nr:glycoside hydrolase [Rhexocercosporidium sp. MPI-PUGE-AT-0058]